MKVFYFTGTGNSLSVAKQIGGELYNIATTKQKEFTDDSIGIVFPVFCYNIPNLVEEFLKNTQLNASYIWAIATCGSSVGHSFLTIDKLLKRQGRKLSYCAKIVLPDSCVIFATPLEKHKDMLDNEKPLIASYLKDIASRKEIPTFKDKPFKIDKLAWWGMKNLVGTKNKHTNEKCTNCGICAKICPTNNIKITDKPHFGDVCETCFACIQWCPEGAIEFGKNLKINDKTKYNHPDIKVAELITRNKT